MRQRHVELDPALLVLGSFRESVHFLNIVCETTFIESPFDDSVSDAARAKLFIDSSPM